MTPRPPATAVAPVPPQQSVTERVFPSPTPFSVLESDEADDLFSRPDTCTNPQLGYTVTFPDDWYTNTEIGEQEACSWFTPDFFEVLAPGEVPAEIWISIGLIEGIFGYNTLTPTESSEEVEVGGYAGHRAEYRTLDSIDDADSGRLTYHYVIPFGSGGPTLLAATDDRAADYELAKAVLDRLMASMQLEPLLGDMPPIPVAPTGPLITAPPISAEHDDGTFRLVLEASQDRYRAGQPIEVVATVTYLGPAEHAVVRGSSHSLIGFAVESVQVPLRVSPAFTTDCAPHDFVRDVPVEFPFAKSGGLSDGGPFASFHRSYFASDVLRLPAGKWRIGAGGSLYVDDCGDELHALSASVTVLVEP